jgi:predicted polyphosphate/ATP-dependent NAD kinase
LSFVGIIANPASGKDIRRLVSHATVVNNHEKVSIVRRLMLSLYVVGVNRVEIMPDSFGIGVRALRGLCDHPDLLATTSLIDMPVTSTADDSLHAARYLRSARAGCIVTLGGDGTCRVVAKGCGEVPMLPISTGTNNVVPTFVEGTIAGMAAATVARHPEAERSRLCTRHKRLSIHVNGEKVDQALVEVALVLARFTGARAVWEADRLRQIFVSQAQPGNIGISSVVAMVRPVSPTDPVGVAATVAPDGRRVLAPLAPGSVVPVGIDQIIDLEPGVRYPLLDDRPAVLALDGEREIALCDCDHAEVTLDLDGPWIVDVERTLREAVADGAFTC